MKSLWKMLIRYLTIAVLIVLSVLIFNILLYIILAFQLLQSNSFIQRNTREIAAEFISEGNVPVLSEKGLAYLENGYAWAMVLDDSGAVLWQWRLPEELNRTYTVSEVSAFSKWYLDDYPVTTRIIDCGLLVTAHPRNTMWKYNISESLAFLDNIPGAIAAGLTGNLLFVVILCLILGLLFYRSLRSIAVSIERLSRQEAIRIPEKGMTALLAHQLNQTSRILEQQKNHLKKRDDARTAWISGVSHDIRTPLSLIVGYADALKSASGLNEEQRQQVQMIEDQSIRIKRLIEDLNLTSKLEYEMQPLRLSSFSPAGLLREIVSGFYNQELPERYSFNLYIDPALEKYQLQGDRQLLHRAFHNLIHNSIHHNPQGCAVTVAACPEADRICFQIADDGCGIPNEVIQALTQESFPETDSEHARNTPHIMGLRIVCQIVKAHGWILQFRDAHTIQIQAKAHTQDSVS